MALVHRLVHLHSGEISIESTLEQGTLVKIVFPKGNKYFHKATIVSKTSEHSITVPEVISPYSPSVTARQNAASSQRILVVEGNDDLRIYLTNTLSEDYQVQSCLNGKEALEILSEFKPDLVLSDIMMPEMSGDELCAAIKGNIDTSHVPVLLLTALGDEKNMLEGLKIGADDYMAKPFSINLLKASINRLIANRYLLYKKYGSPDFENEKWPKGCRDTLDLEVHCFRQGKCGDEYGRSGFYGRYALFTSPHEP